MTRAECEKKLLSLMEQAIAVYREYNPTGEHLMMNAVGDHIDILDSCGGHKTIDITRFKNGEVWNGEKFKAVCAPANERSGYNEQSA